MPFLETFKAHVARFSKRKQRGEERTPLPDPGLTAAPVDPILHLPAIAASTRVHDNSAIHNDQPTNSSTTDTSAGLFTNAHHFSIGQLTAISQNIHTGTTTLQHLMEKGMPAAIHDSSDRAYPPQCHPSTRKCLRERVTKWGIGGGNDGRMLWLLGLAAVGKSAVAQTIAEEFQEVGRLGASFFFSRPNHLNDPDAVIPTLVYQLTTKVPQYKHIINSRLADDPWILKKNRRTQFRELIIEPFHILMTQHPHAVPQPLLIILDGLDECKDKQAQCEFIDMISTHVRQVDEFPLRWMICSRPEWHLESLLSDPDFHVVCKREELQIDDGEAQKDVKCLLGIEFDKIRKRYKDRLPDSWPPEDCFYRIIGAASGHLGFASFVLRFVGDRGYGDPDGQLKVCMKFLDGGGALGGISPLHSLDLLYRQILSDVPANDLPTTMRILGLLILYSYVSTFIDDLVKFLNLDPAKFHRSLERLHSILYVSPPDLPPISLRIYHASFSDFLKDPVRSGRFCLNEGVVQLDIALQSLHWLGHNERLPQLPLLPPYRPNLFSAGIGWAACCEVSGDSVPSLISRLECFDFSVLGNEEFTEPSFGIFLQWLYSLGSSRNKSLIAVIGETSQPRRHVACLPKNPRDYITSFIPEARASELPFTLNIRLGKVTQVYITLEVHDDYKSWSYWHQTGIHL